VIEQSDVAAQLRRRRDGSDRLPPLADGRRDPLDVSPADAPVAPRQGRPVKALSVVVDLDRGLLLARGVDAKAMLYAVSGQIAQWSQAGHGFVCSARWAADLLALGEYRGYITHYAERRHGAA